MNLTPMHIGLVFLTLLFLVACEQPATTSAVPHPIPEADSVGGKLFKEFCTACHGAPRPASHKVDEWPNIVLRMQTHRIQKAYAPLTDLQMHDLVTYLQKYAAK